MNQHAPDQVKNELLVALEDLLMQVEKYGDPKIFSLRKAVYAITKAKIQKDHFDIGPGPARRALPL